jgi:hypothetical protein
MKRKYFYLLLSLQQQQQKYRGKYTFAFFSRGLNEKSLKDIKRKKKEFLKLLDLWFC